MSIPRFKLQNSRISRGVFNPPERLPLGRHLVNAGVISPQDLIKALNLQLRIEAPLGEILIAEGWADQSTVLDALALQYDARRIDLKTDPPEPALQSMLPAEFCMHHRIIPWLQLDNVVFIATARPDQLQSVREVLARRNLSVFPVITSVDDVLACIARQSGLDLAKRAEQKVKASESCRNWDLRTSKIGSWLVAALLTAFAAFILSPVWFFSSLVVFAAVTLFLTTGLKIAAFVAQIIAKVPAPQETRARNPAPFRQPCVSVMVPLLHEKEIAQALIARLSRLTYPKALLDVVLVLEERDVVTRQTLANTQLPPWMKIVEVPQTDGVTTKPRALNYALDFCRGSIIGVWDAEDQPQPDQIETVTQHFHSAPPEVVCLQGVLDYYNPRANWLARCFTIEYATWWRIIMPGIARLGLVIPLGGTTLFFRRDALDKVQGWDAHNVTEDADLGFRLARYGYRTEMIATVTHEEATCRPWAWVRQRSRWLKGFMVTYLVHMRHPHQLYADLGCRKFWGFQIFFLAALSQFVLAPLLWSFWLVFFGFAHPLQVVAGDYVLLGLATAFAVCELINIGIGMVAVSGKAHRHLIAWVPSLILYFPLGALASYKAIYELIAKPFYWDKTQHGHSLTSEGVSDEIRQRSPGQSRRVSNES